MYIDILKQDYTCMCRYSLVASGHVNLTNNSKMKSLTNPRWKRVVLKISGAALVGSGPQNVDPKVSCNILLYLEG